MSVISVADVEKAKDVLQVAARDIVTPLAVDRAKELGIRIEREAGGGSPPRAATPTAWKPPARSEPTQRSPSARPPNLIAAPQSRSGSEAMSGALYRRGAPVRADLRPEPTAAAAPHSEGDTHLRAAVVGAGHVGAMTALRLAEPSLFGVVTLIDIVPGLAEGLALDMWHGAGLRRFTTRIEGSTDMAAVTGADFIVVTAGKPRQPGMSRTDLTGVNAEIVGGCADAIRRHAPKAIVVVVTNPLEEMTHLMARRTGFAPERVIGMAGVLDTARFCSLVGLTGVARPQDIEAYALGSHGPEMVIPLSQAKAGGRPLESLIDQDRLAAIVERTRDSGAEVVKLLQKGSAYFSPAESAAAMVVAMASGRREIMPACVQSRGAYGTVNTRVGLPVRLGREGVEEIVQMSLRPDETSALKAAASSIAKRIAEMG